MSRQLIPSISKPEFIDVLDEVRKQLITRLGFTRKEEIYLAGGTGLAFYLHHRTSVDFDFYTLKPFEGGILFDQFREALKELHLVLVQGIPNTLQLNIEKNIHISCFYYPYNLIRAKNTFYEIDVASLEDVAAMKTLAIGQRGKKRDFVDIFYLIKRFGLPRILEWTKEKYPNFVLYSIVRGLTYFEDAKKDKETGRIQVLDPLFSWTKAKKYIENEVIAYQKKFIKKG